MFKSIIWVLGVVCLLSVTTQAVAADDVNLTLGNPTFAGDGCSKDNTEIALTEDKQTLSILFSAFQVSSAKAGENQRKKCDIRVPVKVPAGYSISIITSEYRGYNFLPPGSKATLAADYFLVGVRGPMYKWQFPDNRYEDSRPDRNGRLQGEFYRKNEIQATGLVWGPCGKDTTIAIKSSLDVTSNFRGEKSDSSLDSLDLTTKTPVLYKLTWKKCTK